MSRVSDMCQGTEQFQRCFVHEERRVSMALLLLMMDAAHWLLTSPDHHPSQCTAQQDDGSDHGTVVLSTSPDSAGLRHRPRSPIIQRMASQRSARSDAGSDLVAHHSLSSALSVDAAHLPEVMPL